MDKIETFKDDKLDNDLGDTIESITKQRDTLEADNKAHSTAFIKLSNILADTLKENKALREGIEEIKEINLSRPEHYFSGINEIANDLLSKDTQDG